LDPSGAAYCWGANDNGQLGDGSATGRTTPTAVVGGFTFQSLSAGSEQTCAVGNTGAAYCWGRNEYGQLGDGTTTDHLTPTPVAGGLTFRSLAVGWYHTCGLTTAGAAYCWGRNDWGQLGDSTTTDRRTPVPVAGGVTFQGLGAGDFHNCGMTGAGLGYCWGMSCCGQLGVGIPPSSTSSPLKVASGLTFRGIVPGWQHTCGLTVAGDAYCWGADIGNLVGTGPLGVYLAEPRAVVRGPLFTSLTVGSAHACGLNASGVAYCWGDWYDLAVGRPRPEVNASSPVPVSAP
jgi:alpha-tubulin suppressor-like RCC1 family protein